MSLMTPSQMEAVLLDRIEKAVAQYKRLQHSQPLVIGNLAYNYDRQTLNVLSLQSLVYKPDKPP